MHRSAWLVLLLVPATARAATWTVCAGDCDFASIQDAVAASGQGDVLEVASETFREDVVFADRQVTLVGGEFYDRGPLLLGTVQVTGASVVELTGFTIASSDDRPLTITGGEVSLSRSLLRSTSTALRGGLVHASGDAVAWFESVEFRDGYAVGEGGSIAVVGAEVTCSSCLFQGGTASVGGHVAVLGGRLELLGGQLIDGSAPSGGAVGVLEGEVLVQGTRFERNVAGDGGAVWVVGGAVTVEDDAAFVGNQAGQGGAVAVSWGELRTARVWYCGNTATSNGGAASVTGGSLDSTNDVYLENEAYAGGAVHAVGFQAVLGVRQAHLVDNRGTVASALWAGDGSTSEVIGSIVAVPADDAAGTSGAFWAPDDPTLPMGATFEARDNVVRDDGTGSLPMSLDPADTRVGPLPMRASPIEVCGLDWQAIPAPAWGSIARDGGDSNETDKDRSPADAGAFGGPDAAAWVWTQDWDDDGFPFVYDCSDQDSSVNPEADEVWYDGVDGDCDYRSDDDQDGDGFDVRDAYWGTGHDCDDEDASRYPGAADPTGDGVDQDCDLHDGSDADGDGYWTGTGDCDDTRADVNPGAFDGDASEDRDCDGYADLAHPLRPRTCATGASAAGWLALAAAVASGAARRRSDRR